MILYYMEIIIAIGEGETLQQALRQLKMDVAGPFTLTIKTEKKTTSAKQPPTGGKKRGRPKGRKNKLKAALPKKEEVPQLVTGVKEWSNRESVWIANQPRPTEAKVAKIGRDHVSAVEAAFAGKFGYRRTYKSLLSKWNRMRSKLSKN